MFTDENNFIINKIAPWNITSIENEYIQKRNFVKYCILITVILIIIIIIIAIVKKIKRKIKTIDYDEVKVVTTSEISTNS